LFWTPRGDRDHHSARGDPNDSPLPSKTALARVRQAFIVWTSVSITYVGQPTRMYLVGRHRKVEYDSGPGPWGILPRYLDAAIREYMGMEPRAQ
jgi:hypothetical protein